MEDPLDMRNEYINLIHILSSQADVNLYEKCCDIIDKCDSPRKEAYYPYILKDILMKFDQTRWNKWIFDNLENNLTEEVWDYLVKKTIPYNEVVSKYFERKLKAQKDTPGVIVFPDNKSEIINFSLSSTSL